MSAPRMVPAREWSCSLHAYPETHECDCDHCELPHYLCHECANGQWRDKLDDNGDPVMREATMLDMLEIYMRKQNRMFGVPLFTEPLR